MTWKDILKQEEADYYIYVIDPNDSRPDAIVFEPAGNNKFEANDDANEYFDETEYPETPLIPFFKKFGDSNKQFTEQEIESAAQSMGLKTHKERIDEEDDPEEYEQWMAEGQFNDMLRERASR